jgi:isopenicillin-N epimerase
MPANAEGQPDPDLRSEFLLRPDVVFLNHGSFGACPCPVFKEYQRWQLELERQPVEFLGRRFDSLMREARESLAVYVGADANDLVYVTNATTALNAVARSLSLGPGDEVLATDHEYGALDRTWRFVCARRGATYVNQPLPLPVESVEQAVEAIWSGVTERTRVLFLSHITSPTALILPVAELVQRARAAGILSIVDGAHAPGQIPLDLDALGADFYAGNLHKWLCAPKGAGFLHVRKVAQPLLEPLVVSWGWQPEQTTLLALDTAQTSPFILQQEWQGTRDISAHLAVQAAIRFQEEHNWPQVRRQCHELLRYARGAIGGLTGLVPICPDSAEWYAQMAAFPLPSCDAAELKRRLYDEYRVEVPITEWSAPGQEGPEDRRQLVRVSVQGYNTRRDVETLIEALTALLPEVGRF